MAETEKTYGFIAVEQEQTFYNGKAVLNLAFAYFYDDDEEELFDFPGYVSSYFYIYDERGGQLIKSFTTQITRNSNVQVMNTSVADMTFAENGKYFFEQGYNMNGYEVPLRYGPCKIK